MKYKKLSCCVLAILLINGIVGCEKKKAEKAEFKDTSIVQMEDKNPTISIEQDKIKPVTKDDSTEVKNIYKEYLRQISESVFEEFILIDLDFNGVPELLGGNYSKTYSPVDFASTIKDGVVTKLNFKGDDGITGLEHDNSHVDIGLGAFSEIKLFKLKGTSKSFYIGKDISNTNYDIGKQAEYEINLDTSTIYAKEIFYDEFNNEYNKNLALYRYMKLEISKSQFDARHKEYYNNIEEVNVKLYKERIDLTSEESINEFIEKGFTALGI
jgi:hypothetical protein